MHPKVKEYLAWIKAKDLKKLKTINLSGCGLVDSDVETLFSAINEDEDVLDCIQSIDLSHNNLTSVFGFPNMVDMIEVDFSHNSIAYIDSEVYQNSHVLYDFSDNPLTHISRAKLLLGGAEDLVVPFRVTINAVTLRENFDALFDLLCNHRLQMLRVYVLLGTKLTNDHVDMLLQCLHGDNVLSGDAKRDSFMSEVEYLKNTFLFAEQEIDSFVASEDFISMVDRLKNLNSTQRLYASKLKMQYIKHINSRPDGEEPKKKRNRLTS